ncbi:MAG: ABC transporter permease subunit [Chloroflexota bacterium]
MTAQRWELLAIPLRSLRRSGMVWAFSLGALIALTVAFWPAFRSEGDLSKIVDALPQPVIDAFGLADFGSPAGFLRGNLYAVIVPLLVAVAAVLLTNGQTAGEEDSGRMEAYLAQPVSRQSVFAGRVLGAWVWLLVISAVMLVAQLASDAGFGLSIGTDRLVATIVMCLLLGLWYAGLTAMVAGWTARPGLAMGVGIGLVVTGYVVMALFPISNVLAPWRHISPWDWAMGGDPLVNATEAWRYLALAAPALVFSAAGMLAFTRRDIQAA